MKKIVVGILIICFYCFPFVYFSMHQDFVKRSLRGYLIMIVVTLLLAFFGRLFSNLIPLIIGNIISGIISFYFIGKMKGVGIWDYYFKPLTPTMLLILVSVLNLIPQLLGVKIADKLKGGSFWNFIQK